MSSASKTEVDLLITAGCVVTVDKDRRILRDGAVAVRGRDIVAVGERPEIQAAYHGLRTIDAPRGLLIPGLIDAHNHPIDYLIKGAIDETPQIVRLRDRVIPYEDRITEEEAYVSSMATFVEMIRQGTTCFADGAGPHPGAVARAALECGIRGIVARKLTDLAGPFGGAILGTDEAIALANATVDEFNGAGNGLLRAWYDIDLPGAATPKLTRLVREESERRDVGVISHLVGRRAPPGQPDLEANPEIAQLEKAGLLGPRTLLAHIGWIPSGDIERLLRSNTSIVHCPGSSLIGGNGWVAGGVIPELVAGGATVALGTDASIISRHLDMVRTMYVMAGVYKEVRRDPTIMGAYQVFEMASLTGARALGWESRIGSIEPGKAADLAIFDVGSAHWWPDPFANPVPDLVYSGSGRDARTVVIDGKVVMEEGRLVHIDEERVAAMVREASEASFDRLGVRPSGKWPSAPTRGAA